MASKCSLAVEINSKKHKAKTALFGARTLLSTMDTNVNMVTYESKPKVAEEPNILLKSVSLPRLQVIGSYLLSNIGEVPSTTFITTPEIQKIADIFKVSTAAFSAINKVFDGKSKIVSSVRPDSASVVLEINENDPIPVTNEREFVRFNFLDIKMLERTAKSLTPQGDLDTSQYEEKVLEEAEKLMTLAITSALYRGFSVILPSTLMDSKLIRQGIRIYNAYFNSTKRQIRYASKYRASSDTMVPMLQKINDPNAYLENLDNEVDTPTKIIESVIGVDLIDLVLSDTEKLRSTRVRITNQKDKIFIATSIFKVFKKFIPNLEVEFLGAFEIGTRFSESFKHKNSFIIENKIIINLDKFDTESVFHEFGHYYMRWLSSYNKELYDTILKKVATNFPGAFKAKKAIYDSSGITFTDNEILEEVFVSRLGIKATNSLMKVLPKAGINSGQIVSLDARVVKMPLNEVAALPVIGSLGIKSIREEGSIEHFGNFFTGSLDGTEQTFIVKGKKIRAEWPIKVGPYLGLSATQLKKKSKELLANIDEAVTLYRNVLLGNVSIDSIAKAYNLSDNQILVLEAQREWIIDTLKEETFENKDVLYFKSKLDYTSHATVLAELVNVYSKKTRTKGRDIEAERTAIYDKYSPDKESIILFEESLTHLKRNTFPMNVARIDSMGTQEFAVFPVDAIKVGDLYGHSYYAYKQYGEYVIFEETSGLSIGGLVGNSQKGLKKDLSARVINKTMTAKALKTSNSPLLKRTQELNALANTLNQDSFLTNGLRTIEGLSSISVKDAEVYSKRIFTEDEAAKVFKYIENVYRDTYEAEHAATDFAPKRRRTLYYSDADYTYSGKTSKGVTPPKAFQRLIDKITRDLGFPKGYFDMVLVNEYKDGSQKIGFHSDNEPILNNKGKLNPSVVTISFGDTRNLILRANDGKTADYSISMDPGVGIIMGKNGQTNYKHGIVAENNKTKRFSITLRHNADKSGAVDIVRREPAQVPGEKVFSYRGTSINTLHVLGFEQVEALKQSIDYLTGNTRKLKTFTINGAAGTGKTTIVGLIHKWFKASKGGMNFMFSTPTHSANKTLALANLANGYTTFPSTIQSLIADIDYAPKMLEVLKGLLSEGFNATLVIDEVSMLTPVAAIFLKGISNENGLSVEELRAFPEKTGEQFIVKRNGKDISVFSDQQFKGSFKIIFLGDIEQLPSIKGVEDANGNIYKRISSVFDPKESYALTEVHRTKPNTNLDILTRTREKKGGLVYEVTDGDNSYTMSQGDPYYNEVLETMDRDLENTYIISYTKKRTQIENKKIKKDLTGSTFLQAGDKIIGYAGTGSKKIEATSIANSVSYFVKSMELMNLPNSVGKTVRIEASSGGLMELVDAGVTGISGEPTVDYLPMSITDSFQVVGIDAAEFTANREYLSAELIELADDVVHAVSEREYGTAVAVYKRALIGLELGGDYIFNVETGVVEPYVYSKHSKIYSYKVLKDLTIEKGIDYGYAINTHKAQGVTIVTNFVDGASFNAARNTPILDFEGNVFNTEKNAIIYTTLSRASKKTVVNNEGLQTIKITNAELQSEGVKQQQTAEGIEESISTFTENFVKALTGIASINVADTKFTLDSTITDIYNVATEHGGPESALFKDAGVGAMESIKNFFIKTHSLERVASTLAQRSLIRVNGQGYLILLDELGNYMDVDGNLSNVPTKVKATDTNRFSKIKGYLYKHQNLAKVMFDMDMPIGKIEGVIRDATQGIELIEEIDKKGEEKSYYVLDGVKMQRTSNYSQEQFTSTFDQERTIISVIFRRKEAELLKNLKKADDKSSLPEELETEAKIGARKFILDKGEAFLNEKAREEAVYEFKREEGTYLHTLAELLVSAMNYTTKIDYNTTEDRKHTYFLKSIREAITSIDKNIKNSHEEYRRFFKKYFFDNGLIKDKSTAEFKQFKKAYEFILTNRNDSKAVNSNSFLEKLGNTLKDNVFNVLTGPLTLMSEVKLGSKALGVAGTIDLLVIDGKGEAHIFDYKTKEAGQKKWEQWSYPYGNKMQNEMGSYPDNAKNKASIQLSVYKVLLLELGIKTSNMTIFYIENILKIGKYDTVTTVNGKKVLYGDTKLGSKTDIEYSSEKITALKMNDVSALIVANFVANNKKSDSIKQGVYAEPIMDTIIKASAGMNIDVTDNVDTEAKRIYNNAIANKKGSDKILDSIFAMMGLSAKGKGLFIRLTGNIPTTLDPKFTTESQQIEEIKRLLIGKKALGNVESAFEDVYYSLNRNAGGKVERVVSIQLDDTIRKMLHGIDAYTHDLEKFSSDSNFGLAFTGNFMVKNNITGETRVIILNHDSPRFFNFAPDRWTVFGNYMSDRAVKTRLKGTIFKSNTHDMRLIKAGLMLAKKKSMDPNFKVSMLVTNPSLGGELPIFLDLTTVLKSTKLLLEVMVENGEKLHPDMLALLEDPELFESVNYQADPIKQLSAYIGMVTQPEHSESEYYSSETGEENLNRVKDIVDNFDPHNDFMRLQHAIHEFRHTLHNRLTTTEAKKNSDIWKVTDDVIQFLAGFNQGLNPTNTTFMNDFLFTPNVASNAYQSFFNRKTTEARMAVNGEFLTYKNKFNEKIHALAKAKGFNISMLSSSLWKQSRKEIFKNLYIDPTNSDRNTAYKLKNANDRSLITAEKEFLKFYYESLQEYTTRSLLGKKKRFAKPGWMPLLPRNNTSMSGLDANFYEITRKNISNMFKSAPTLRQADDAVAIDEEFSVNNRFEGQIPREDETIAQNFTYKRRQMLGIDEQGNTLPGAKPLSGIEDDLELVLDTFVVSALDAIYYRDVSAFGRSLVFNIMRHADRTERSYDKLINTLMLIQRKVILHQSSEQGGAFFGVVSKGVTLATIAGTVPQALLETFTNPLVTATNYLSDKLHSVLFKKYTDNRMFSLASYTKATSLIWGNYGGAKDLIIALDRFYGFSNSDTSNLKKTMSSLRKHSLFTSDKLMWVNQLMMTNWQRISMLSYMIEEGTYDAHSLDNEGNLVYDQSKDKRFLTGRGIDQKTKTENEAKLLATKEQLAKEPNGLTGAAGDDFKTRKMARAYTFFDVNRMKENIVEIYAGIDEASKSLASYYTWMGLLSKMRIWIFPKMGRYFSKRKSAEENYYASKLVKIKDTREENGYRYEWRGEESEGILFTLVDIGREMAELKGDYFKKDHELSAVQKKNVSKGLSDGVIALVTAAAAAGLYAALDEEDQKDPMVQLLYARINMAVGDVFFLKSLWEIIAMRGSLFVSAAVIGRIGSTMGQAAVTTTAYMSGADVTAIEVANAYNDIARNSFGFYRTIETITTGRVR